MPIGRPRGQRKQELLHPNTARRLRTLYRDQWGQEWPHDDRYLKVLWDETSYVDRAKERRDTAINSMRECDTTIPPEYGRVETPTTNKGAIE